MKNNSNIYWEPNAIELLGYAKNDIVNAMEQASNLPSEFRNALHKAYSWIDLVQEHLYES